MLLYAIICKFHQNLAFSFCSIMRNILVKEKQTCYSDTLGWGRTSDGGHIIVLSFGWGV